MQKNDKVNFIITTLQKFFPDPPIPLDHETPFQLLVAVVLSAQCTDDRVNLITPALFKIAPGPQEMAKLDQEKIYQLIRPCGLGPQKSKALKRLSEMINEDYAGQLPETLEELEKLPGVGHKTASVIVSQVFQIPAFPVDTHIHRLAQRWGMSSGKNVQQTERDLKNQFPETLWNQIHLQMIFYGRKFCQARGHDVTICSICRAIKEKSYDQIV